MSNEVHKTKESEILPAHAKGVKHQHASALNAHDAQFLNEALANSHEVMNTLAPPDAPPPPPQKPRE